VGQVIDLVKSRATRRREAGAQRRAGEVCAGESGSSSEDTKIVITPLSGGFNQHHVSITGRYATDIAFAIDALARAITDLNAFRRP